MNLETTTMKTKFAWVTIFLLLVSVTTLTILPSCEKVKEAAKFKVKYDLPDSRFTVDPLTLLKSEHLLYSQPYTVNIDSILGANKGLVSKINVYKIRLSVVSPDDVTLGWIDSGRITITPAGGVPIDIATTPAITSTMRTFDFIVKDTDVSSAMNGTFQLDVYGSVKPPIPTSSFELLLQSGLEITISPLK